VIAVLKFMLAAKYATIVINLFSKNIQLSEQILKQTIINYLLQA